MGQVWLGDLLRHEDQVPFRPRAHCEAAASQITALDHVRSEISSAHLSKDACLDPRWLAGFRTLSSKTGEVSCRCVKLWPACGRGMRERLGFSAFVPIALGHSLTRSLSLAILLGPSSCSLFNCACVWPLALIDIAYLLLEKPRGSDTATFITLAAPRPFECRHLGSEHGLVTD
jgi:hypothetical protein